MLFSLLRMEADSVCIANTVPMLIININIIILRITSYLRAYSCILKVCIASKMP